MNVLLPAGASRWKAAVVALRLALPDAAGAAVVVAAAFVYAWMQRRLGIESSGLGWGLALLIPALIALWHWEPLSDRPAWIWLALAGGSLLIEAAFAWVSSLTRWHVPPDMSFLRAISSARKFDFRYWFASRICTTVFFLSIGAMARAFVLDRSGGSSEEEL